MTYAEWLREGEDELAKMPAPTREEDLALQLALDAENADADDCPSCKQPLLPDETHCPACRIVQPYVPRGRYER